MATTTSHFFSKLYHSFTSNRLCRQFLIPFFNAFYNDMDAVRVLAEEPGLVSEDHQHLQKRLIINKHYLPHFLLSLFFALDVFWIYFRYDFSYSSIPANVMPMQKLLPAELHHQADVFFGVMFLISVNIELVFLFHNMTLYNEKYRMFAFLKPDGSLEKMVQGQLPVNHLDAKQILALHQKAKVICQIFVLIILIECLPFYYYNIFNNWNWHFEDYFLACWMGIWTPQVAMNIYAGIYCFILNGRYLRIKQHHQMRLIRLLNSRMIQLQCVIRSKRRQSVYYLFSRFVHVNTNINRIHSEIQAANYFWSRYLSIYFAYISMVVTYFAYAYRKLDKDEEMIIIVFILFFGTILFVMLLWITLECSIIVVNNKKAHQLQVMFAFSGQATWRKLVPKVLLQFDHIEANRKAIGRIGFTLFDSIHINAKMFELLLAYISAFFMRLVKKELEGGRL